MPLPELCPGFQCDTCSVVSRKQMFSGSYRDIIFKPSERCISMRQIIDQCRPGIEATFEEIIRKRLKAKAIFTIWVFFHKINFIDGTVDKEDYDYMSVDATIVHNVDSLIDNAFEDLDEKIENFTRKGSNWIVAGIEQLIIKVVSLK
jgi:hypothetical protein